MKGDFTRRLFSRENHYSGVRMQQGRVQLDADWNELVDIQAHLRRTGSGDVLGPNGAPKSTDKAHFQLSATPDGADLAIAPGRFYVDGILCELEQGTTYLGQPDLPTPPFTLGSAGALTLDLPVGTYLAYLDVWERLVTALEDPRIREVALGGPDTAVRTRTVWQVKLLNVSSDPAATTWTQALPAAGTGKLAAQATPASSTGEASLVPAGAGYRRLENQLYRVEVHAVSGTGRVTAKWSRDNGAVVAPWRSSTGTSVTIGSSGRDELQAFSVASFVELTDDAHELNGESGLLYSVASVKEDELTLDTTSTGSPGPVSMTGFRRNPKVRRWEGKLEWDSTSAAATAWLPLEDGVEVRLEAGTYRVGDYWLIPARHITADVEWPRSKPLNPGDRPEPLALPPHGVVHHYTPIAVVRKTASALTVEDRRKVFPALTALTASDVAFDPAPSGLGNARTVQAAVDQGLTQLHEEVEQTAEEFQARVDEVSGQFQAKVTEVSGQFQTKVNEVSGQFQTRLDEVSGQFQARVDEVSGQFQTKVDEAAGRFQASVDLLKKRMPLVLLPTDDLAAELAKIGADESAHIHFAPGTYPLLTAPLVLKKKGHILVTGSGAATRLAAAGPERLLAFEQCQSVVVRDLYAETQGAASERGMKGVLSFVDCPSVTVEGVSLRCGADWQQGMACITVHNTQQGTPGPSSQPSTVRIRGCQLEVGHQQVGIQLVNVERSQVEDNVITTYSRPASLDVGTLVGVEAYRTQMRRLLISRPMVHTRPVADPTPHVLYAVVGTFHVYFDTDRSLLTAWQDILRQVSTDSGMTTRAVLRILYRIADAILANKGEPRVDGIQTTTLTTFRNWFERWRTSAAPAVASQGIIVAGQHATEIRIRDNTLRDVLQGIHVGLGDYMSFFERGTSRRAGRIHITGNEVHVLMTSESVGERHGIFVGNFDTLQIESNHVRVERRAFHSRAGIEAIRVYGSFGRMMSIRQNHLFNPSLEAENVGIRVKALNLNDAATSSWRVYDNVSACSSPERLELMPGPHSGPALRG